jgi:cytoskeletal protein RodZ
LYENLASGGHRQGRGSELPLTSARIFLYYAVMTPLVEQLRWTRERAGLSIEDIAARTKIQIPLLEAMERGDFQRVPGGLFVRGFLRAYAREVGLDPEVVVADYLDQYEPRIVLAEATERPTDEVRNDVILAQADPEAFSMRKLWPAAAIAAMVIGIFMTAGSGSRNAPAAEAQAIGTSGQTAAIPEPAPRPAEALTLDMRAKRDVWVAATADSQRIVYRTLRRASVTLRRAADRARIGDADAITGSAQAGPLGARSAQVRGQIVTPGTFRPFNVAVHAADTAGAEATQVPQIPRPAVSVRPGPLEWQLQKKPGHKRHEPEQEKSINHGVLPWPAVLNIAG